MAENLTNRNILMCQKKLKSNKYYTLNCCHTIRVNETACLETKIYHGGLGNGECVKNDMTDRHRKPEKKSFFGIIVF